MLLKLTTYIPAWKYTECDINLLWFSICKALTTNNPAASVTTEECTVLLTQCWHQTCMFLHNLSSSMLIEHKPGPTNLLEMLPPLGYLFFCISSASPSYWWLPGFSTAKELSLNTLEWWRTLSIISHTLNWTLGTTTHKSSWILWAWHEVPLHISPWA